MTRLFVWISRTAYLVYVYGLMTRLFVWISRLLYVYGLMTRLFVWISLTACLVYVYGLMTRLFVWISRTASSRTYFVTCNANYPIHFLGVSNIRPLL